MKLTYQQLEAVKKKLGVSTLYSWSRIDKFISSPYEYFLQYIMKAKPDNANSVYGVMGGICHNIIEKYYNGEIEYDDMIDLFVDGWTTSIDISDLKFDRCDEEKNEKIKKKYYANLKEFFVNHKSLDKERIKNEQFVTIKVGDSYLQGYIDAIYKTFKKTAEQTEEKSIKKNKDIEKEISEKTKGTPTYRIIDWKTSTKYSGSKIVEYSGQLVIYALALIQRGIPIENIELCWNFLKYVTVTCTSAKGDKKDRDIERSELGAKLQTSAKMWLKKFGYSSQLDYYLKLLLDTNSISCLPDDVQEMFEVNDCYVYIPLTQKLIDKWTDLITSTIRDIELREKDYAETKNDEIFFDTEEQVKANYYYFSNLCSYSADLHKPYKAFIDKKENENNDMFSNIGIGTTDTPNVNETKSTSSSTDANDLSWLDEI